MSPSLPAPRREWFWSLPAFAIILSFLWYRKKRGSLKSDTGGVVETGNHQTSVDCEEESENSSDKNLSISDELLGSGERNQVEVFETVDHVTADTKSESSPSEVTWGEYAEQSLNQVSLTGAEPTAWEAEEEKPAADKSNRKSRKMARKLAKKMAKKSQDAGSVDQRQDGDTACILEKKLAELDLSSAQCNGDAVGEKPLSEDVAERDSANNSPSEVMLASPSVSGYSDTHSEGSSDSGKGCSEMLTPSRTPASGNSVSGDLPPTLVYEFEIAQYMVGLLIGKHGYFVNEIKKATNASIYIKRHPNSPELKICAVEGTQMDVDSALNIIRRKFPKKRWPELTLEQIVISQEPLMIPIFPENYQLYLVEGVNNDVILSSLVSAGHFFLQQPTHPTFPSLATLNACMADCYSQPNQPRIPEGVGAGVLCAAPAHDGWYRAQITEMEEGSEYCTVKFVDYGGYLTMPVSSLLQIRADFINLPFQAAECYLAHVKPANDEVEWSEEAKGVVEKLTFGNILQAQVFGYAFAGVPLIYLYTVVNNEIYLINRELVERGYAEWDFSETETEEVQEVTEDGAMGFAEIQEAEPLPVPV